MTTEEIDERKNALAERLAKARAARQKRMAEKNVKNLENQIKIEIADASDNDEEVEVEVETKEVVIEKPKRKRAPPKKKTEPKQEVERTTTQEKPPPKKRGRKPKTQEKQTEINVEKKPMEVEVSHPRENIIQVDAEPTPPRTIIRNRNFNPFI